MHICVPSSLQYKTMKSGLLVSSPVVQQLQSGAVELLGHTNLFLTAQALMGTRCLLALVRVMCDLPLARPQEQPGLAHVPVLIFKGRSAKAEQDHHQSLLWEERGGLMLQGTMRFLPVPQRGPGSAHMVPTCHPSHAVRGEGTAASCSSSLQGKSCRQQLGWCCVSCAKAPGSRQSSGVWSCSAARPHSCCREWSTRCQMERTGGSH